MPERGDHVVHAMGDDSVIIVRGLDGAIRDFHNSCRHHGTVVCGNLEEPRPKLV